MQNFDAIKQIIQAKCDEEEVTLEKSISNDLGCDSLDVVEIAMDCEREFGIYIPDEELESVRTVEDLVVLVNKKLENKNIVD